MKDKILTILFCIIIFGFGIVNLIIPDKDLSYSERRYLTKLPSFTFKNIMNDSITDSFDKYFSDHFVFREKFRNLKAFTQLNVLNMSDYNKLYINDNYIFKIEYPMSNKMIEQFNKKINTIYEEYLNNSNVYYSIIPDKNYYSNTNHLKIDYSKFFDSVKKGINSNIKYIDIVNDLTLEDYYYTDIHWKQENLNKVVNTLSKEMNFEMFDSFKENKYDNFYGSYYGQIGLNKSTDSIVYLSNNIIDNCIVKDNDSNLNKVYDTFALGKMDSYDIYLGGATSLIEIKNNSALTNRELIIFRDSFSSSLAPLLLKSYKKIILIDLRYMTSSLLNDYVDFNNKDVLFLYNTSIINNSNLLK